MDRGRRRRRAAAAGHDPRAGQSAGLSAAGPVRPPLAGGTWAIEGATGLGSPLARRLSADGIEPVDVPAKLAARVRMLSSGHGRKNDNVDAVSVGVTALTAPRLSTAAVDEAITALRAVTEHRDDLVAARTQTLNRLHRLLTQLVPGGAPSRLSADRAAALLGTVRARSGLQRTLRQLATDLISEVRRLDKRVAAADKQITTALDDAGSTLTELHGIGPVLAGRIHARVGLPLVAWRHRLKGE